MMTKFLSKIRFFVLALMVGLICSSAAFGSATIEIQNADAAGVGFNDPTPVAPVGGNSGTTLGQQRLIAFQYAASIWGATLTSGPVITVRARWIPLECTANTAVLGSAGSISLWRNFPNAPFSNTFYGDALANALAGTDLDPSKAEINAQFNVNLGTPGCLENKTWYYGLDNNHGTSRINLVTVLLHELGHGVGFASFTNEETGALVSGFPSIYDRFLLDNTTGKTWTQMTDAERVASATNSGNLVWNGAQVLGDSGILTAGRDSSGHPRLWAPSPVENGSSVSHWDRLASPNQLMEPNISTDLTHFVTAPQDLTFSLLKDIGWCTTCQPVPVNDNFASAQTISGCTGSVTGTNVGATRETGEPRHSPDNNVGAGSVWYQWQAPSSGSVTITTANSDYDTLLAVYTGPSVGSLADVLQTDNTVAKSDDVDPNHVDVTSSVTFNATAGTVYKIAVDGWGGSRGNISLNWTQSPCSVKADQTISFSPLSNKTFGDAPFNVSAVASSGLPVSFSILSGPASISSGSTVTISGAGTVTVRASQAGNASFNAATPVDQTFTVARANQTITFNALPGKTFGDAPFSVSATSTSGLSVGFVILSGPATISGNTITLTGAGTVTVRASQGGNTNYNPAPVVDRSFTVSAAPTANPIDGTDYFIRQHYLDFLDREPDAGGFIYWTDILKGCANDPNPECENRVRVEISSRFFIELEFQRTGFLVMRLYKASYGIAPTYLQFITDRTQVQNSTESQKLFTNAWVQRSAFLAEYPLTLTPAQFVQKLYDRAGVADPVARAAAEVGLTIGAKTRADVMFELVELASFQSREYNPAFVRMQYFGYLRRDAEAAGESYWLNVLNNVSPNNYQSMICAFVNSNEYQLRFGSTRGKYTELNCNW